MNWKTLAIFLANGSTKISNEPFIGNHNATVAHIPDVYEEADAMLNIAYLTYCYSSVTKDAKGSVRSIRDDAGNENDNNILQCPVTFEDILKHIVKREEERTNALDSVLKHIVKREERSLHPLELFETMTPAADFLNSIIEAVILRVACRSPAVPIDDSKFIVFDSESKNELVYGISVSQANKRITVSFKGTTRLTDMLRDAQVSTKEFANPFFQHSTKQKPTMNIHEGFFDYLFEQPDRNGNSKYKTILAQLKKVCTDYPDCTIYVTGHSLGGALASLFAFYLAAEKISLGAPVTCVSIASPMVGDQNWRDAFMYAEKMKKLRHLRISNFGDIVPKVPWVLFEWPHVPGGGPVTKYCRHTGIHVQLYGQSKGGKPCWRISYPKDGQTDAIDDDEDSDVLGLHLDNFLLKLHYPEVYDARLGSAKDDLQKLVLADLYMDRKLVGDYNNV